VKALLLIVFGLAGLAADLQAQLCAVCNKQVGIDVYLSEGKVTNEQKRVCDQCILLSTSCYLCLMAVCAHEYGHAWIRENVPTTRDMDRDTEEGLCELIAAFRAARGSGARDLSRRNASAAQTRPQNPMPASPTNTPAD
jgi:hypothetical protein